MNNFFKAVSVSTVLLFLLFAMARTSGRALVPFAYLALVILAYVAYRILWGKETEYPRTASGFFERTNEDQITLSADEYCSSCMAVDGEGVRMMHFKEFVIMGVPLIAFGQTERRFCTGCQED